MLMGHGNATKWLSLFYGGDEQIICLNETFFQGFIWPPATEEYIHTGSTHQQHNPEYKQKQKEEDQSYSQGNEISLVLPWRIYWLTGNYYHLSCQVSSGTAQHIRGLNGLPLVTWNCLSSTFKWFLFRFRPTAPFKYNGASYIHTNQETSAKGCLSKDCLSTY